MTGLGTIIFVLAAVVVIAILLIFKYLEYRRMAGPREENVPASSAHGMILSTHTSPLGTMAGNKMLTVEVLLDSGEKQTLRVTSFPLFQALTSGERGTITYYNQIMTDFREDGQS